MGNQHSSSDGGSSSRSPRAFRGGGALGLSKSELDKRCQPSGLYDSCQWEEKAIRKLVGDGRIAARLKGDEKRTSEDERECPICFLNYPEVNVTKCCHANICTECYLQVRPQKEKSSSCPFCNNLKLQVTVAKKLEQKQIEERDKEEQLVHEARMRARASSEEDGGEAGAAVNGVDATSETGSGSSGFGSSLEQNPTVALMKARSESFASEENNVTADDIAIQSLAMTPEERRALEDEMRAQHSHPLALRLQAEAAERRLQNDRAYYRSQSGSRDARAMRAAELFRSAGGSGALRRSRGRGAGGRDWNQIVDAFERGGNGQIQSIDDLVLLEAAIVLSMEEEGRLSRAGEEANFDAARHARDGFPLVRSFLSSRRPDDSDEVADAGLTNDHVQNFARHMSSSRRSRRHHLLRSAQTQSARPATGGAAWETAAMLMRGISEEEQMALAIAASLQDQSAQSSSGGGSDDGGSSDMDAVALASNDELELEGGERAVVGIILDDDADGETDNANEDTGSREPNRPIDSRAEPDWSEQNEPPELAASSTEQISNTLNDEEDAQGSNSSEDASSEHLDDPDEPGDPDRSEDITSAEESDESVDPGQIEESCSTEITTSENTATEASDEQGNEDSEEQRVTNSEDSEAAN